MLLHPHPLFINFPPFISLIISYGKSKFLCMIFFLSFICTGYDYYQRFYLLKENTWDKFIILKGKSKKKDLITSTKSRIYAIMS